MAATATDHYEALGVSPEASGDDIRRAFRELARRYHPDATGGDEESADRFKRISEAYSVLSDPHRRREYDASRAGSGASPFGGAVEDIFDAFFGGRGGGGRQRSRAARGASLEVAVVVDLREAVFGAERTIDVERHEACEVCSGTGCAPGTHPERCSDCEGTGERQQVRRTALGSLVTAFPCARCGQSGWTVPSPCVACKGAGRRLVQKQMRVAVPAGIESGDRMRLRGEGEAGLAGGPDGDLYVHFAVEPDDRFVRRGDVLETWVEIPMTTATLGGAVEFESMDGDESITVQPGTQSGASFRIRGRGVARREARGRGDLVVRVHVATPTDLDDRQVALLRELAGLRGEEADDDRGIIGRVKRALGIDE